MKLDRPGNFWEAACACYPYHDDDLYTVTVLPSSWIKLQSEQIHELVAHWKKSGLEPGAIMNYMTIIRRFLEKMDCQIVGIGLTTRLEQPLLSG